MSNRWNVSDDLRRWFHDLPMIASSRADDSQSTLRDDEIRETARRFVLVIAGTARATYPLPDAGEVVIGRSRRAGIHVDDASISRRHAVIRVADAITIEDLESANGTRVREAALEPGVAVAVDVGDVIEVGAVMLIVVTSNASVAAEPDDRDEVGALRRRLDEIERRRIVDALARCGGNQTRAATLLGMPRRTLVSRLSKYDLPRPRKS